MGVGRMYDTRREMFVAMARRWIDDIQWRDEALREDE